MTVDIILLLILIVFVLSSYRKGLILSLCTLLILVVSCLGASVAQEMLTPKVVAELHPQLTETIMVQMEDQVTASVDQALADASDAGISIAGQPVTIGDLLDLLERFGLEVEQSAQNAASDIAAPIVESTASAMATAILNAVVGFLIFVAAFLIIFLILHAVELGINTVDRLPVIHTLNHLGGGLVGLISGAFFLTMVMTIVTQTGLASAETFQGPVSGLLYGIVARIL